MKSEDAVKNALVEDQDTMNYINAPLVEEVAAQ